MARTISTKLAVEGESQYKQAIANCNSELTTLKSRLQLVSSEFKTNQNSIEALSAKQEALTEIQQTQQKKVETLKSAYENARSALTTYQTKTSELSAKLEENNTALSSLDESTREAGEQWASYSTQVTAAEKKLEELRSTTGDTSEEEAKLEEEIAAAKAAMAKLEEETDGAAKTAGELTLENQELNAELSKNESYQDAATKACNKWETQLNKAQVQLNNTNAELDETEQYLKEAEESSDGFATSINEFGQSAEDAGDQASESFQNLASVITSLGLVQTLKELAEAISECVETAADFESEMSTVSALSGATGDELESLTEKAKELGATTKYTATEAAEAFEYMALAGWDTEEMLDAVDGVLNLAAASAMDLGEASDIVTDYLTAFGLSASDADTFVDQLAYAMSNSNTTTSELGEAYKNCAATASSLGYSVEDVTAVLMTMANAGVKGGEAGTGLSTIMTRLATDTKNCASELEEYGVYVYDTEGNMNDLADILNGCADVWEDLTDQEQASLAKTIAGTSQYSKFITIMNGVTDSVEEGCSSFEEYAAALEDCGDTAEEMADTQLDNFNGKVTIMNSALDAVKTTIGEQLTPVLGDMVEGFTSALNMINSACDACPALTAVITGLLVTLGTLAVSLTAATLYTNVLSGAFTALAATISANPIGVAVGVAAAAVVGLSSALAILTAQEEDADDTTQDLLDSIEDARSEYEGLCSDIEDASESVSGLVGSLEGLLSIENKTSDVEEDIIEIVDELNELIPDLGLSYDEATDSINMTTDAILEMSDAQSEQEQYAADVERLSEAYAEQAELAEALEDAQANLNEVSEAYNEIGGGIAIAFSDEYAAVQELTAAMDENEAEIAELEEATATYGGIVTEEMTTAEASATLAINNMITQLDSLESEYSEAYTTALESIQGQMNLWDTLDGTVAMSTDEIMTAMESQTTYWTDYSDNLENLMDRNIDGLDEFVASVADGSEDSAAYIAGMADMTDEELEYLVNTTYPDLVEAQEDAAASIADMETDYSDSVEEIVDATAGEIEGLDLSKEAKSAANDTLQGYINGLNNKSGTLYSRMSSIASNAISSFKRALGISSPSKEMKAAAGYSVEGFNVGVDEGKEDVETKMEELATSAMVAFNAAMNLDTTDIDIARNLSTEIDVSSSDSGVGDINENLIKATAVLSQYLPLIYEKKTCGSVYINKSKLVGEIIDDINDGLGEISAKEAFG